MDFADLLLGIDRFLQKRARRAIPDFDKLWEDPAGVLGRGEVVIGPIRRYAVATVLGLVAGFALSCGFALSELERPQRRAPADRPPHEQVLILVSFFTPPVVAVGLLLYVLRGGEMRLRPDGVVLRYHRRLVFCPWSLFQAEGEPWKKDRSHLVLPVWPPALDEVVQGRGDAVRATGRDVRTKQLYFLSKREAVLADLYAVRLDDLGDLLLHLGQTLGPAER